MDQSSLGAAAPELFLETVVLELLAQRAAIDPQQLRRTCLIAAAFAHDNLEQWHFHLAQHHLVQPRTRRTVELFKIGIETVPNTGPDGPGTAARFQRRRLLIALILVHVHTLGVDAAAWRMSAAAVRPALNTRAPIINAVAPR